MAIASSTDNNYKQQRQNGEVKVLQWQRIMRNLKEAGVRCTKKAGSEMEGCTALTLWLCGVGVSVVSVTRETILNYSRQEDGLA